MAIFQTNPPNNFNEIYDHISRKVCTECMLRLQTSGTGLTRPSVITEAPNSAISFTIQTNKIIGKSIIKLYCNQGMYWLCFSTYDECLDTLKAGRVDTNKSDSGGSVPPPEIFLQADHECGKADNLCKLGLST